jgi:hypothetical protein
MEKKRKKILHEKEASAKQAPTQKPTRHSPKTKGLEGKIEPTALHLVHGHLHCFCPLSASQLMVLSCFIEQLAIHSAKKQRNGVVVLQVDLEQLGLFSFHSKCKANEDYLFVYLNNKSEKKKKKQKWTGERKIE